jgi:hypothetical protein
VRHAREPRSTESNPKTKERAKKTLAKHVVIGKVGWTSKLIEKPRVATANVRNREIHRPS